MLVTLIAERKVARSATRPATEKTRDARLRFVVEQDRNKTAVAFLVINIVVEKNAFPIDALSFLWRYMAFESPSVLGRADANDELRMLDAGHLVTPSRPVHNLFVVELVEFDVDAVASQRKRQRKHSLTVFR